MRDVKSFLANLPHYPGVYQMLDKKGAVLYVGKAKNLKSRLSSYFNKHQKESKVAALMKHTDHIEITVTHHENEAVLLECNLIKKHLPRYNILLRDDKSYPYIMITTSHSFPRIDLYRGTRKKDNHYFGPYPNATVARETMQLIQKLFQLRTCRDSVFSSRKRPCLLYQIDRCAGPCVEKISSSEYMQNVRLAMLFLEGKNRQLIDLLQEKMENASSSHRYETAAYYRDQVKKLNEIQNKQYVHLGKGDADMIGLYHDAGMVCIQLLSMREGRILNSRSYYPKVLNQIVSSDVMAAFITQYYLSDPDDVKNIPKALIVNVLPSDRRWLKNAISEVVNRKISIIHPLRGEKKKWLALATDSAKQSLQLKLFNQSASLKRLHELQSLLHLKKLPERIECFDISHTQGEATVGSCVVFDRHGPVKRDYRYFRITETKPGDDVAAMRQVLTRRFKGLKERADKLPDVIFIDGGMAQLAAAHQAVTPFHCASMEIVAISKGPRRKRGLEKLHRLGVAALSLPEDSSAFHLIQHIRDEAHRFAIRAHRARRDKTRTHSLLESIPGVGIQRRRALLRYFGGIQGLAHASLDELMKVPGIHQSLAERIFNTWHDATT